jgi:DNA-binding beta-propeller fold protein YncE
LAGRPVEVALLLEMTMAITGKFLILGVFGLVAGACTLSGVEPKADEDEGGDGSGAGDAVASSGSGDSSSTGTEATSSGAGAGPSVAGLDVLGNMSHSVDAVIVEALGTSSDGLQTPSDVAFHPTSGELWVTNRAADSMTIFTSFGTDSQSSMTRYDGGTGQHFLANPSGLAFGASGSMATIHEEDQPTQGSATPWDFMGPTLWPSSSSAFDGGHSSHLDMLHNTPNGMGIAGETANTYWVFDGEHASLTRYAFHSDHGPGGSDHTDGEVARFAAGQVARVAGIPSNLVFDPASSLLYVADTGNNRIATLDTSSGSRGGFVGPDYDGAEQYAVNGATLTTLIDGSEHGLQQPSGLEIHDGVIFVADNATSTIYGFGLDGTLIDWLEMDVPPGCLAGMTADPAGNIVVADGATSRVLRVSPL